MNALPAGAAPLAEADDRPSIRLLAEPDTVAQRLIARILESSLDREERDSRKLRQWAREMRGATERSAVQKTGVGLVVAAEIAGAAAWSVGAGWEVVAPIFGAAILGILFHWLGQYRESFSFPAPDFGLLKETWDSERTMPEEDVKQMEAALRARVAGKTGPTAERILTARSIEALSEGDYEKAGLAARLLLARNPESWPGPAGFGRFVGLAGRGGRDRARAGRHPGKRRLEGAVGLLGCGVDEHVARPLAAEALLEQVIDKRPEEPTLLNFRALCQLRRGKIQSAIISARRACAPRPRNCEHAKFLVNLLLEGGYLGEARTRLLPLDKEIPYDQDLMLAAVRLDLGSRNFEGADRWAETLLRSSPPAYMIVQVAAFYELSRSR